MPANEALGAGPIAAPTATPMASMPAAKTAVMRSEGRRGGRGGSTGVVDWEPALGGEPPAGVESAEVEFGAGIELLAGSEAGRVAPSGPSLLGDVGVSGGVVTVSVSGVGSIGWVAAQLVRGTGASSA